MRNNKENQNKIINYTYGIPDINLKLKAVERVWAVGVYI